MQICQCGAQAGYLHKTDCPYPLYRDDEASVKQWREAQKEYRKTAQFDSLVKKGENNESRNL